MSITHIRGISLVVLTRVRSVWRLTGQQQYTSIERCCEAGNDGVRLRVTTGGEWTSAVAKDVL